MACSKYTITNTGSTIVNFNYRNCSDSLWEYQVELLQNQTKNIWLIDDTYSTAFINNIEITNVEVYPPIPPTPPYPLTDENIYDAVNLWYSRQSVAEELYGPIEDWNTTAVTNMSGLFTTRTIGGTILFDASTFDSDIASWDVSNVTNMSGMFSGATLFNQDIRSWDVSNVTNMSFMFKNASSFNLFINLWDVSNVTTMASMFAGAASFYLGDNLESWDVSNVTDMSYMFNDVPMYNGISLWNVSGVTNMSFMFANAYNFDDNISSWDVSNVTNMSNMFNGADSFEQNIGSWDVSNVTNMELMFGETGSEFANALSTSNYNLLLSGWSLQTLQPNVNFSAGNSQYTNTSAKSILTSAPNNWTITDGGID